VGNHNDTSRSGILNFIANPSAKSGAPPADSANLSKPTEDLEATQSMSLDGINNSSCDPKHAMYDSSEIPSGDIEDLWLQDTIYLDDIKLSAEMLFVTTSITPLLGVIIGCTGLSSGNGPTCVCSLLS
jgi:hypothetical protein